MSGFKPDDLIRRSEGFLDAEVDDETILMQVETGQIFGLAEVSKEIWARLAEPVTFGALVDELTAAFEVGRDECARDVSAFLADLEAKKFVTVSHGKVAPEPPQ